MRRHPRARFVPPSACLGRQNGRRTHACRLRAVAGRPKSHWLQHRLNRHARRLWRAHGAAADAAHDGEQARDDPIRSEVAIPFFIRIGHDGHVTSTAAAPDPLRRSLSTMDAVTIGLGAMLGAGVFVAFAPAAAAAGPGLPSRCSLPRSSRSATRSRLHVSPRAIRSRVAPTCRGGTSSALPGDGERAGPLSSARQPPRPPSR